MAGNQVSIAIDVTANANQALSGLRKVQHAVQGVGKSAHLSQNSVKAFGVELQGKGGANRFVRTGLQQMGYQFGDFAVQVGGGTSAIQAFGQQAPQLLQIFGPIGSLVGAGVAIFAAIAVTIQKAAKNAADATPKVAGLSNILKDLDSKAALLARTFDTELLDSLSAAEKKFGKLTAAAKVYLAAQRAMQQAAFAESQQNKQSAFRDIIPRDALSALKEYIKFKERIPAALDKAAARSAVYGASLKALGDATEKRKKAEIGPYADAIIAVDDLTKKFQEQVLAGVPYQTTVDAILTLIDALPPSTKKAMRAVGGLGDALLEAKQHAEGYAGAGEKAVSANEKLAASWRVLEASINQFATAKPLLTAAASQLRFQEEVNKALAKGLTLEKARGQASKKVMSEGDLGDFQLRESQKAEDEITAGYEKRAAARAKIGTDLVAGEVKRLQTYSTAIAQLGLMTKGMAADVAAPLAVLQAEWKALDVPVGKAIAMTEDFIALMAKSKQASAKIKLIETETGQGEQLASLNRQIELIKSGLDPSLAAQMASFEASIKATSLTGDDAAAKLALLARGYVAISAAMAEAKKAAAPGEALKAFDDEQLRILEATNAAVKEFDLLTQGVAADVAAPLAAMQAHWEALNVPIEEATARTEAYIAAMAKLKAAQAPVASIKEDAAALEKAGDIIGSSFATAFEEIVTGSASAADAFKRMAVTIISEIIKMEVKAATSSAGGGSGGGGPLAALGKSLFSGLAGLLGGGASTAATTSSAMSGFGAGFGAFAKGGVFSNDNTVPFAKGGVFGQGNIIPFAGGGIVNRPTMFPMANGTGLMGEAGPEAIIPLSRGSDGKLGVSGGGTTVNQTINVTTGIQQTVRAEIQSLMPQIAAASTQAVLNARRRGGSFARSFS